MSQSTSKLGFVPLKKAVYPSIHGFFFVSYTGFEPVTSALSRQRSEPTELIAPKAHCKCTVNDTLIVSFFK